MGLTEKLPFDVSELFVIKLGSSSFARKTSSGIPKSGRDFVGGFFVYFAKSTTI